MRRRASGAPAPRPARCCRCSGGRQACPPATPCRSRARSPPFVAQPRRELDAEMPEPADAEDRHECPRSRAAVLQRVEGGDPRAHQRRGLLRGHVVRDPGKRRGGADQSVPPWPSSRCGRCRTPGPSRALPHGRARERRARPGPGRHRPPGPQRRACSSSVQPLSGRACGRGREPCARALEALVPGPRAGRDAAGAGTAWADGGVAA